MSEGLSHVSRRQAVIGLSSLPLLGLSGPALALDPPGQRVASLETKIGGRVGVYIRDITGRVLVAHRAVPEMTEPVGASGRTARITGTIPAAEVHAVELRLGGLTRGEGVLTTAFASWAPVSGEVPIRERSDHNPLNRAWYLAQVSQG